MLKRATIRKIYRETVLSLRKVNENNFNEIPAPCRYCLYWQTAGEFGESELKPNQAEEKRRWFRDVAKEFGSCAEIAYVDGKPAGFVQFAPLKFFPRAREYASGPLSENAVFIACLYLTQKEARGRGYGSTMLERVLTDLTGRGFKAVETFGRRSSGDNPSGPVSLYLKHGFRIKNEKDDFPLLSNEPQA